MKKILTSLLLLTSFNASANQDQICGHISNVTRFYTESYQTVGAGVLKKDVMEVLYTGPVSYLHIDINGSIYREETYKTENGLVQFSLEFSSFEHQY
jgi:hypothetical protein